MKPAWAYDLEMRGGRFEVDVLEAWTDEAREAAAEARRKASAVNTASEHRSVLKSKSSMSNTGYHANGKPNWWARVGNGDSAKFLDLPRTRGDSNLSAIVSVLPGTKVAIGAGKGSYKTIRELSTTQTHYSPSSKEAVSKSEAADKLSEVAHASGMLEHHQAASKGHLDAAEAHEVASTKSVQVGETNRVAQHTEAAAAHRVAAAAHGKAM